MNTEQLSTNEILQMILGDFDADSNTEAALEAYLFAKKISNAASVALKLTSEHATKKLIEQGGKGSNEFASYSIVREFERIWQPDENRDVAIAEIEAQKALIKTISERLVIIEKEMEKAGKVEKREVGQTIKVTLLDKI